MCELVLGFFPHSGVLIITHLFQVHPFPCRLRLLARVLARRFLVVVFVRLKMSRESKGYNTIVVN